MADPRISATELGEFRDLVKQILRRLDELEKPTGTQLSRIVEEVRSLVASLDARVQEYITLYSMTRAEIVGLSWLGILPAWKGGTGTGNASTNIFTTGGPWYVTYVKANGEMGHAPSLRALKQDIRDGFTTLKYDPSGRALTGDWVDPMRFLDLPVQSYRFIEDVLQRGDQAYIHYGFVAEDVADAGLDLLLQHDGDDELMGVAYDRVPLLHHEILRTYRDQLYEQRWISSELRARVTAQQTQIDDLVQRVAAIEGAQNASQ